MTTPVGPEQGPIEHKQSKVQRSVSRSGREISKKDELTPEELRIQAAEEESLQRSETPQPAKPLSPGDVRRGPTEEKHVPLPELVFSPGPKTPVSARATPKPSLHGPHSPSVTRQPPAIGASPSPGAELIEQETLGIAGPPPSPVASPSDSLLAPVVTRSHAQLAEEALLLRSKLTDLQAPKEAVDHLVKSWPLAWHTWAEPVTVNGEVAYRQVHHLKGVKVHKDEDSGQMVVDIALPETARGRHRQGKSMARVMEDGRVFMFFRFKGPKTPDDMESMDVQFHAQEILGEAWVKSGGDPKHDPLSPYLIEGRKERTHVGKTGEVVTRYIFEKADGSLYSLSSDKDDALLPEEVRERNKSLRLKICLDTAKALALMHARGLVHKDIQPKNILYIDSQGKITDFDTLSHSGDPFVPGGTAAYMPPECSYDCTTPPQTDDPSLDMFAYGVMLAEELNPQFGDWLHEYCIMSTQEAATQIEENAREQAVEEAVERAKREGATEAEIEAAAEAAARQTRTPDQIPLDERTGYEPTLERLSRLQEGFRTDPEPWPFIARLIDPDPAKRPTAAEAATYLEPFLVEDGH